MYFDVSVVRGISIIDKEYTLLNIYEQNGLELIELSYILTWID